MSRTKEKEYKITPLSLSLEAREIAKKAEFDLGLNSMTAVIEYLLKEWYNKSDMGKLIKEIETKKQEYEQGVIKMNEQLEKCKQTEQYIKLIDDDEKEKYVNILARLMREEREPTEIRRFAIKHSQLLKGRYSPQELETFAIQRNGK